MEESEGRPGMVHPWLKESLGGPGHLVFSLEKVQL